MKRSTSCAGRESHTVMNEVGKSTHQCKQDCVPVAQQTHTSQTSSVAYIPPCRYRRHLKSNCTTYYVLWMQSQSWKGVGRPCAKACMALPPRTISQNCTLVRQRPRPLSADESHM